MKTNKYRIQFIETGINSDGVIYQRKTRFAFKAEAPNAPTALRNFQASITQDDYFGSLENYIDGKALVFPGHGRFQIRKVG